MMNFRQHHYQSACGQLRLFARDYGGEGPPLLLMHGLTRNSSDFEPLARHLARQYRLIVSDQRGRGLSEYDSDAVNYRPDNYAADMFALLASLDVASPGIIGTSMGGLIAMVMNAARPGTFPAIVFNDIGPVLSQEGLDRITSYVGGAAVFTDWDAAAKACAVINQSAFPDFGKSDWLAWAQRTCRKTAAGGVTFAYDPAIAQGFPEGENQPRADMWPLWKPLGQTPVLAIRGALSDLLSVDTVTAMRQRHKGFFSSVEVPNRGHAPLLDEPAALAAITAFLEEHLQ